MNSLSISVNITPDTESLEKLIRIKEAAMKLADLIADLEVTVDVKGQAL